MWYIGILLGSPLFIRITTIPGVQHVMVMMVGVGVCVGVGVLTQAPSFTASPCHEELD